jgi:uncharacterized membrane protein
MALDERRHGWQAPALPAVPKAGRDMAPSYAEAGGFQSDVAEVHEGLGTLTAVAFILWALARSFAWWRNWQASRGVEGGVAVVELLGVGLVVATAYFGGELVFGLGVNVAHAVTG